MGLDRKDLPDRLLRLISPADRRRIRLPKPKDWPDLVKRVPFPGREVETRKFEELQRLRNPPKPKAHGAKYSLPVVLAFFAECGLPTPTPEYRFDPDRKWRFDFAFHPYSSKVALEVQGGLFSAGAHVRGAALMREYEKLNRAAVLGWRVLFVTPDQLLTEDVATMIRQALAI